MPLWPPAFTTFYKTTGGAPAAAAAAAAAACQEDSMKTEKEKTPPEDNGVLKSSKATDAAAFGRCSSIEAAYQALAKAGLDPSMLPIHVEADQMLNPASLTVFAGETALRNNARAAIAIQRSKKRGPDGHQQLHVGWILLT